MLLTQVNSLCSVCSRVTNPQTANAWVVKTRSDYLLLYLWYVTRTEIMMVLNVKTGLNPGKGFDSNIGGTYQMLRFVERDGSKGFIGLSLPDDSSGLIIKINSLINPIDINPKK